MPTDWVRYWRAGGVPVEAMHARFTTHVYHRHSHESYSFGVTEAGAQAFRCRDGSHVSAAGMVMLFNPDDPHDGHAADGGGFTYRMIHIWPDYFARLAGDVAGAAGPAGGALPLFREPVADDPEAAGALCRLHAALAAGGTRLELGERLLVATRCLLRHAAPGSRPDEAPLAARRVRAAARIRDLIHDTETAGHPAGLAVDDLAEAAGCSRYAAYRAFRAAYGMAPSDYQRQLRVRAARRLLAAGASPAAASAAAGFADQAHLTRWFRRYYGVTPGAYRAALAPPETALPDGAITGPFGIGTFLPNVRAASRHR